MNPSPPSFHAALALVLAILIQYESLAKAAEATSRSAAGRPAPDPDSDSPSERHPPHRDLISLRFDGGLGGGSVGLAARAGAEFDIWLLRHLALGVTGAVSAQAALVGSHYDSWFFGPGLVVREHPEGGTLFASAAVGITRGAYTDSEGNLLCGSACDTRYEFSGLGAALGAGWISRAGPVDIGASLKLDMLFVDAGGSRTLDTVTANFIMGFSVF